MKMARHVLFIIADGAHARFVAAASGAREFVTLREVDGSERLRKLRAELRASPAGRGHESMSPTRRSVGPTGYVRHAKEDFVGEIADLAAESFGENAEDGVVLIAPARLIGPLRQRLRGRMNIIATLSKDLTKVADHDLAEYLAPLLRAQVA
jgi:protein required for attachment to host cells